MKSYRIIFECYEESTSSPPESTKVLMEGKIEKPNDVFSFGIDHAKQISLIDATQTELLMEQQKLLSQNLYCPRCENSKLAKCGTRRSIYHDVFTDHSLVMHRHRCRKCNYESGATVKSILGDSLSGDLTRLQAELGASNSFRESEELFAKFCRSKRRVNNHDRVKCTVEDVGTQLRVLRAEEGKLASIEPAEELVINVDGGHIKSVEEGKRSFEAMTAVVYRPEALVSNESNARNILSSKHCAASANADGQTAMISNTVIAALKQGLSPNTTVTALCDGAENCWQIINAITPLCSGITRILDWFHVAMKIENISLPKILKEKLEKVKWYLWRGNVDTALTRLNTLIESAKNDKINKIDKLKKFKAYILNNGDKIVDYENRKKKGLVFTSNLAESTVESLINQRCKGKQHMRWSRAGIEPLLQVRAAIASNDWNDVWQTAVINAAAA